MDRIEWVQEEKYRNRGQSTPQIILAGLVLMLISPALISMTVDLKSGFASVPGFSDGMAALIAVLFLLAIVFSALGIE